MAAFNTWEQVLEEVRASDPDQFFMIHLNEGEKELDRTRFMTKMEAIAYCLYKISREKVVDALRL